MAVIGRDATEHFSGRLPRGVSVGEDERMVVLPGDLFRSAKPDIPDH